MENPANPLEPDDFDDDSDSLVGPRGVRVNRRTALMLSGVWRGVHLIANAAGKTPLERKRNVDDEADKGHPTYRLLMTEAVGFTSSRSALSAFEFKRTLTANAILTGGGYAWIERDGAGRPLALIPLLSDRTFAVRADGRLWYVTSVGGPFEDERAEIRRIRPEDVLHIHGLGFDGLSGYPLLEYAAAAFGLGLSQQTFAKTFFDNAATPTVVLECEGPMSDKAYTRLLKSWASMRQGLKNAHKTAILEEGTKAHTLSWSAADSQLVESRKLTSTDIANYLLLPPHKVGGEGRTAFASLAEENQSVLDEAFDPWFETWESECNVKLLTEQEKRDQSHQYVYDRREIARNNPGQRSAYYRTAIGAPYMTRNEGRKREGLPPIEGGDDLLIPLNLKAKSDPDPSADTAKPDEPAGSDEAARSVSPPAVDRDAVVELCRDTLRRMAKRLTMSSRKDATALDPVEQLIRDALEPVARCLDADHEQLVASLVSAVRYAITGESAADADQVSTRVADIIVGTYPPEDHEQ